MLWSEHVSAVTGQEAWSPAETDLVLDMAREVAHATERRFAPLTSYALGVAVGQQVGGERSGDREPALQDLIERLLATLEESE